jgi:hypothetical protein
MILMFFKIIFCIYMYYSIPLIGIIIGGFFDKENRTSGNLWNDLPSTLGFITGIIIDIYLFQLIEL